MNKENKLEFFIPKKENGLGQWLAEEGISAGFPSPADDFKETRISLDRELVKNKEATFYARVSGDSMVGAGLDDGDLLVIDRSLNPENGKIAVLRFWSKKGAQNVTFIKGFTLVAKLCEIHIFHF